MLRPKNSPPSEGCLKGGVVNSPPSEGCLKGGVVINNTFIPFKPVLILPYNASLKTHAKELRYARNLSEVLFWKQIHKGKFHKLDFDRQRILGNYIVDFYVKKLGLVVEIDGSSHNEKHEYDQERDRFLNGMGLQVFHVEVKDVFENIAHVMQKLEHYIVESYGAK